MNKRLQKALARQAELKAKIKALNEAHPEDFSKEVQKEFDEAAVEYNEIGPRVKELQKLVDAEAAEAKPIPDSEDGVPGAEEKSTSATVEPKKFEKGEGFGAFALCAMYAGSRGVKAAQEFAIKKYGERHEVTKTLEAGSTPGSILVPEDFAKEVVELLRDMTVVRKLNTRRMGLPQGQLTLPRHTAGTTGTFIGENSTVNAADLNLDDFTLSAKKLISFTTLTNELITDNIYGAEAIARDDLLEGMAQTEDQQLLRGVGSAVAPTSFRELAVDASRVQNAVDTAALSGAALVTAVKNDIGFLILQLRLANIRFVSPVWLMSARSLGFLEDLVDANGNPVYKSLAEGGNLLKRYPIEWSNKIPDNLGGATDESEVSLIDASQFIIADAMTIELKASQEASVQIGGSLESAFAKDFTALRAISRFDFNARHVEGIFMLDQVTWGQ